MCIVLKLDNSLGKLSASYKAMLVCVCVVYCAKCCSGLSMSLASIFWSVLERLSGRVCSGCREVVVDLSGVRAFMRKTMRLKLKPSGGGLPLTRAK